MESKNYKLSAIEKHILSDLIDKYERRASERRVIIPALKFKDYDLNNIDKKLLFIRSVQNLKEKDFVDFEWKKFEKNNLLERIILMEDDLPLIYELLGRKTKSELRKSYIVELNKYKTGLKSKWILDFVENEEKSIKAKSAWTNICPKTKKEREEFFLLLNAVDDRADKAMRYLSVRLYGDSKKLEKNYKSKLISIARKYIPLDIDDNEILEYLGISLNPSEILVYGSLEYTLMGEKIDTSKQIFGTSINKKTVDNMRNVSLASAKVLTIENKATYYEYIKTSPKDVFVIYLGGFFGESASKFLTYLSYLENVSFYHWSDIDLGGFRIFHYLYRLLNGRVQPFYMDEDTYLKCLDTYKKVEILSEKQINEIKKMLDIKDLESLHPTMKSLIKYKRRIEQECIDIKTDINIH